MTSGTVSRVDAHLIASDLLVPAGSEGGPVFAADGVLVGISSVADDPDARTRTDSRVVAIEDACAVVAAGRRRRQARRRRAARNYQLSRHARFP